VIKGIPVILCKKEEIGHDPFGNPIFKEVEVVVDDVLVAPSTSDDIVASNDLVVKKAVYTLAIPKGDTNNWENQRVMFFGEYWNVFGFTLQGIEENIPGRWNKKVMVDRYE
jgi:hypothetical protein